MSLLVGIAGCAMHPAPTRPGTFTASGAEPDNPLIPADSTGNDGIDIIDNLFAGLVYVDADGEVVPEAAESLTSEDHRHWHVRIRAGQSFSDGTPLTAESFVRAWKTSAKQGLKAVYPYAVIEGANADGTGELNGLTVTGELTFDITLTEPIASFPDRLVQNAFYPLPEAAYLPDGTIDPDFGFHPIGNGPYQLAGEDAWIHNQSISLSASPRYTGPRKPRNKGFDLRFYTEADAAYNDLLADNVDVIDEIPATARSTFKDELEGRAVSRPVAQVVGIDIDAAQAPHFGYDAEGKLRRRAVSQAIDRELIAHRIYFDTVSAATDVLPPMIAGHGVTTPALSFDPEAARENWRRAEKISPFDGEISLMYAADGGSRDLVEALCHQISQTLGVKATPNPVPEFSAQMTAMRDHTIPTGFFRMSWSMGYPGADNILSGRFIPGGGGHYNSYDSTAYTEAVSLARASSGAEGVRAIGDAQAILLEDLPTIPLYYANVNGGWSRNVDNVRFTWNGNPAYWEVSLRNRG